MLDGESLSYVAPIDPMLIFVTLAGHALDSSSELTGTTLDLDFDPWMERRFAWLRKQYGVDTPDPVKVQPPGRETQEPTSSLPRLNGPPVAPKGSRIGQKYLQALRSQSTSEREAWLKETQAMLAASAPELEKFSKRRK